MSNDRSYLTSLQDYYAKHRALPSYASIGNLLGLKSKSSVAALVARLKLAGYLESTPDRRLAPTRRFFARPLAETPVRAGLPDAVDDGEADALTIDDYLIERPSSTVLIRVKGDSMIDAGIFEGDLVVVEKRPSAQRGDIVIAIVDNQFTLKRLRSRGRPLCPQSREQSLPGDPARRGARDFRRNGGARPQAVAVQVAASRTRDLDQAIVERRGAAEIGERLRRHGVRVAAVRR